MWCVVIHPMWLPLPLTGERRGGQAGTEASGPMSLSLEIKALQESRDITGLLCGVIGQKSILYICTEVARWKRLALVWPCWKSINSCSANEAKLQLMRQCLN